VVEQRLRDLKHDVPPLCVRRGYHRALSPRCAQFLHTHTRAPFPSACSLHSHRVALRASLFGCPFCLARAPPGIADVWKLTCFLLCTTKSAPKTAPSGLANCSSGSPRTFPFWLPSNPMKCPYWSGDQGARIFRLHLIAGAVADAGGNPLLAFSVLGTLHRQVPLPL
jgi:hypothetical protein